MQRLNVFCNTLTNTTRTIEIFQTKQFIHQNSHIKHHHTTSTIRRNVFRLPISTSYHHTHHNMYMHHCRHFHHSHNLLSSSKTNDEQLPGKVYLALGSNLGDSPHYLTLALQHITSLPNTTLLDTSYLYSSSPMYVTNQPPFINAVCYIQTSLSPTALLKHIKSIENKIGRSSSLTSSSYIRNGPRCIDIDILLYNNITHTYVADANNEHELILPHPRIDERMFVLKPLLDIMCEQEKERQDDVDIHEEYTTTKIIRKINNIQNQPGQQVTNTTKTHHKQSLNDS